MGSALSEIADGPILSTETTAGCQAEISRTTRTHLLCLSRAHNKFAIQLYQEFAKDGKRPGNFVICPISVSLGLGMLHLGSRGSSSEELHKVLYLQEVTVKLQQYITARENHHVSNITNSNNLRQTETCSVWLRYLKYSPKGDDDGGAQLAWSMGSKQIFEFICDGTVTIQA